jgi:hypothetical protein
MENKCKFCGRTEYGSHYDWINANRCYKCKKIKLCTLLPKEIWAKVCELHIGEGLPKANIAKNLKINLAQVEQILDAYKGTNEFPRLMTINANKL